MSTSTSQDLRCPRCAAHVRAGSDWCTLCYADLRPAPEPAVPTPVAPAEVTPPVAPADVTPPVARAEGTAPVARSALPQSSAAGHYAADQAHRPAPVTPRGKHARHASAEPAFDPELSPDALLARLAAEEAKNPFGAYAGLLDTPGKKIGLMVGGALLATGLLFLVMAVLGSLL